MPIDDDNLPARDSELAEDCATISKQWDRKLKAELGVAEWEQLMIAVYLPTEFRDIDDDTTPKDQAAALAIRLGRPVAVVNENEQLMAFARPPKTS
jgi:hypothetical protein